MRQWRPFATDDNEANTKKATNDLLQKLIFGILMIQVEGL